MNQHAPLSDRQMGCSVLFSFCIVGVSAGAVDSAFLLLLLLVLAVCLGGLVFPISSGLTFFGGVAHVQQECSFVKF